MINRFIPALGAMALALIPATAHADYLEYTFVGNGSALIYTYGVFQPDFYYGQARFTFATPLSSAGNAVVSATNTSQSMYAYGYAGFGSFQGQYNTLTASGNTLHMGDSGFGSDGQFNTVGATACSTGPVSAFPTTAFNIDGNCGGFNVQLLDHHLNSSYAGTIVGLTVRTVTGSLAAYGLTGMTFAGGVPEPSTWALMLMGFGMMGYALRKRRANVALVPTA